MTNAIDVHEASNPVACRLRWTILLLTCLGLTCQFYAFDQPSALNEQLREHCMAVHPTLTLRDYQYDFSLLYSVYAMPNIVLPLFLGLCTDWLGVRKLLVLMSSLILVGHTIVSVGSGSCSWSLMVLGRVIFGFGGESIQVAQGVLLCRWFKSGGLGFAMSMVFSCSRAGTMLNDIISPYIAANHGGVVSSFWFAFLVYCGGMMCNLLVTCLDYRGEIQGIVKTPVKKESPKLQDVLKFHRIFWLLVVMLVVVVGMVAPFNMIATSFFVETKFRHLNPVVARQKAGNTISLMFFVTGVTAPVMGSMVDLLGLRAMLLVISTAALTTIYIALPLVSPTISMVSLGIAYAAVAAVYGPTVPLIVKDSQLGTAYGVAQAANNLGLSIMPFIIAHLQSNARAGEFGSVIRFFVCMAMLATSLAVSFMKESDRKDLYLDHPNPSLKLCSENDPEQKGFFGTYSPRHRSMYA
jgi:MFS family permease